MPPLFDKSKIAKESKGGVGPAVQEMIDTGAPLAGAVFGGAIGAGSGILTGGTTSIPGAMIGAGLGTAGGTAIAELTRPFLTGEEVPLLEQYRREVRAGIFEGAAEGLVPAGGKAISLGREFLKRKLVGETLSPAAQMTRKVFQKSKGFGAELSLGQITGGEGGVVDLFENVAENAFLSVKRSGRFFGRQLDALKAVQDAFITGLGTKLTPSQAGRAVRNIIDGNIKASGLLRDKLFQAVRDSAPGVTINTGKILSLAERRGRLGSLSKETLDKVLDNGTESLFTMVESTVGGGGALAQRIPLDQALTAKSQLLEFARENAASLDPSVKRLAKIAGFLGNQMDDAVRASLRIAPAVDVAIETAKGARTIRVRPLDMLDKANRFTAITKEAFENRAITSLTRRILKDEPAQLTRAILRPDRPAALRRLERAVGKTNFDNIVRPGLFRGTIERFKGVDPSKAEFGLVNGGALLNHLKGLGDEVVKQAFGPRAGELVELAGAIQVAGTRATGPGRIFIQLAQAGAAATIVALPFGGATTKAGGASAIIFGPALLGKLFFSPTVIRALVDGMKAGVGTRAMARAMTLLSGLGAEKATDRRSDPDKLVRSRTEFAITGTP